MGFKVGDYVRWNCVEGFSVRATIIGQRESKEGCSWRVRTLDGSQPDSWAFDGELEPDQMTRDDVIRSTADHIRRVGSYLCVAATELMTRAVHHDASKWSEQEWPSFEVATPRLAGLTYGSSEYRESLRQMKPAIDHHNESNRHHPEYFGRHACAQCGADDREQPCVCGGPRIATLRDMTLLDLVEMLCDWKAASERHNDGDIMRSIEVNAERFGYGEEIKRLLTNTAKWWFGR